MKFVVWGARGSIAAPGAETVRYGGDTTCAQVETASGEQVIFDLGTGLRRLGNHLASERRDLREFHVLLTHAHWDHLMGLPFFRPLYRPGNRLIFHGCSFANDSIRNLFAHAMRPPFFPVDIEDVAAEIIYDEPCIGPFDIGSMRVERLAMNHPNGGCGIRILEGGTSIIFFPDNELAVAHPGGPDRGYFVEEFAGTDLLVHDAMYLPSEYEKYTKGWGHSRYTEVVELAMEAGVKRLLLWHHDPDRSDDAQDEIVAHARRMVDARGGALLVEAASPGWTFESQAPAEVLEKGNRHGGNR